MQRIRRIATANIRLFLEDANLFKQEFGKRNLLGRFGKMFCHSDIINYGNPKNGFIEILDSDNEWLLVRIENKNAKKSVTNLIRMESVERISILSE